MERRTALRCPLCQGPAVEDIDSIDGIRCRSSICRHNHAHIICPRCKSQDLEQVTYLKGKFHYTCHECTYSWHEK